MNTKHTFWSLLNTYDKIEVPIIQRDYAQGRETEEVTRLRDKFINNFLIESLISAQNIELDFVYGSILIDKEHGGSSSIFIPLDGQQRLTTLFLLHFFVALKEGTLHEIRKNLSSFTYETRPSAHDFCARLIERFEAKNIKNIKAEIQDTEWYSELWDNDPTVFGMLNMLDTFAKNEKLIQADHNLLERLINPKKEIISFYFIPLENFGLTENLYIRMNARGKLLTDFENFKSEFFKIINYNHDLLEIVKDKIEYQWVENLWQYRTKESYVVDSPFMYFLSFITEMLYFKNAEYRATNYESNFLDFKLLREIYSVEENLVFFIFAFDSVKILNKQSDKNILWKDNSTLQDVLAGVVKGRVDTNEFFILFSAINFFYSNKSDLHFDDFIRVVRNLTNNTNDNSRREWPRLLESIQKLITQKNVYNHLLNLNDKELTGFDLDQRKEEKFKAELFNLYPDSKKSLFAAEDNANFSGNITNLLLSSFDIKDPDLKNLNFENVKIESFKQDTFNDTFKAYLEISKADFSLIWGDTLPTGLYYQTQESRLIFHSDYYKRPEVIKIAKEFSKVRNKIGLDDYIVTVQKAFVKNLLQNQSVLAEIREVQKQLYLYYIIHLRINKKDYSTFFKNGYSFGWLLKETKYKSIFTKGIAGCQFFPNSNPIFQTYKEQFRYNLGLNQKNALDEEILGIGNKRDPFSLLTVWANS